MLALQSSNECLSLRGHYISEHLADDNNETFRDLFSPDTNSKKCPICKLQFDNCSMKKKKLFYYIIIRQVGVE